MWHPPARKRHLSQYPPQVSVQLTQLTFILNSLIRSPSQTGCVCESTRPLTRENRQPSQSEQTILSPRDNLPGMIEQPVASTCKSYWIDLKFFTKLGSCSVPMNSIIPLFDRKPVKNPSVRSLNQINSQLTRWQRDTAYCCDRHRIRGRQDF